MRAAANVILRVTNVLASAFALVVEQDSVYGKHIVAFAIVFSNPKAILFGNTIGRTRVEGSCFALGHFLYLTVQAPK